MSGHKAKVKAKAAGLPSAITHQPLNPTTPDSIFLGYIYILLYIYSKSPTPVAHSAQKARPTDRLSDECCVRAVQRVLTTVNCDVLLTEVSA